MSLLCRKTHVFVFDLVKKRITAMFKGSQYIKHLLPKQVMVRPIPEKYPFDQIQDKKGVLPKKSLISYKVRQTLKLLLLYIIQYHLSLVIK